jgi:hypothetical protein
MLMVYNLSMVLLTISIVMVITGITKLVYALWFK